MDSFLKNVPLLANLAAADLDRLGELVEEVQIPAGGLLFEEGSPGDKAYIIKEGEFEILKNTGGRDVLLAVRQRGEVIGEMALLEDSPRMASVRARTSGLLLAISAEQLEDLLNYSPSAARAMLHTMTTRLRATEAMVRQSEKMAQLGTLTAGVAHELNNPAAAAQRGVAQLTTAVESLQLAYQHLSAVSLSPVQWDMIHKIDRQVRETSPGGDELDALTRSDLEYALENWFEEHRVDRAWEFAPLLISFGYEADKLSALLVDFQPEQLGSVVEWLGAALSLYNLLDSVGKGVSRISEIVGALKQYTYLDQAPVQTVDVRDGLDNTLSVLSSQLTDGVNVRREYAENLPQIQAYGVELNQVWTNIIENAVQAIEGRGEIIIRNYPDGSWVIVEVEDNGPGIPEAIQPRIFDPFFTTKPPGQGAGLGLHIAYNVVVQRHKGDIKVFSRPGKTVFRINLPVNFQKLGSTLQSVTGAGRVDDAKIRNILATVRTVAVVGISSHADRPAYSTPAYLQAHGYHIVPVNPNLEIALGVKAYPDLLAVPDKVDAVLVFRSSESVLPIVEQAIQIGAQVVWMPEGVVNEQAAQTAEDAGLEVVMDACMRKQHERLMSGP